MSDRIIWFHSINGCYLAKTGYSWMLLRRIGPGPHRSLWKFIWKLRLPPKVRIFAWQLGNELLPTNLKRATINPDVNKMCPRCNSFEESIIHAVRDCQKVKEVWTTGSYDGRLLEKPWDHCVDWLEDALRMLDRSDFESLIMLTWNIWNSRNKLGV